MVHSYTTNYANIPSTLLQISHVESFSLKEFKKKLINQLFCVVKSCGVAKKSLKICTEHSKQGRVPGL